MCYPHTTMAVFMLDDFNVSSIKTANDVTKPRALNTFLDGLAELGVDKGLIKNKKLLSDLIEKEKGYRNAENTSDNESNNEESSLDI